MISKYKGNGDIEFAPVYFNSLTKAVINYILYRIDNWINEGSGWVIESIGVEYLNVSIFSPLSGSTYIEFPNKLRHSVKGLINIKSNNNKCFLWCHIRHTNPLKIHPESNNKSR